MRWLGRMPQPETVDLYEALGEVGRKASLTAACGLRIGAPDDSTLCYSCGRPLEEHSS